MTLETTRYTSFRGSLTAFVTLIMALAPGDAQTVRETDISASHYWESKLPFCAPKGVPVSTASSVFRDEICGALESWTLHRVGPAGVFRPGTPSGLSITASAEHKENS
jgi:hypothetical protein